MPRSVRVHGAAIGFGAALTAVALFAGLGSLKSSANRATPAAEGLPVRSCSDLARGGSRDAPYSYEYNAETNKLTVSGVGVSYILDLNDTSCRASSALVRDIVDTTLADYNENMRGTCASMRGAIASRRTTARGRPVNLAAAQQFVDRWCQNR